MSRGRKRVRTERGPIEVRVPRDREGSFEPKILPKHQRHFDGFDDKIVSMYARGMSTSDIRAHLQEMYGVEVSPDLVSRATDAVLDELKAWQRRAFERIGWHNDHHHHSGLALFAPAGVFHGRVEQVRAARQAVRDEAFAALPERFPNGAPTVRLPSAAVHINPLAPGTVAVPLAS